MAQVMRIMDYHWWRAVILMGFMMTGTPAGTGAEGPSVSAKHWPPGFFYQYQQVPIKEKEKILATMNATLQKLKKDGQGLIAKGSMIDPVRTDIKTYSQVTILDESGLIIIARRVPNIYYQYPGRAGINQNIFIIIKNAKVNFQESYIRYGFVVEGDFVAYAQKYMMAIMEGLENAAREESPPVPRPPR